MGNNQTDCYGNLWFFLINCDVSVSVMSSVEVSYYQEVEMNKYWMQTTIKIKLEDERHTRKDADQIYIKESCSVGFGVNKMYGCNLGIPEFQR